MRVQDVYRTQGYEPFDRVLQGNSLIQLIVFGNGIRSLWFEDQPPRDSYPISGGLCLFLYQNVAEITVDVSFHFINYHHPVKGMVSIPRMYTRRGEGRNFLLHSSNNMTTKCKPASSYHHAFGGLHLLLPLCCLKLHVARTLPPSHPLATTKKRRRCFFSPRKVRKALRRVFNQTPWPFRFYLKSAETLFFVLLVYPRDRLSDNRGKLHPEYG